MEAEPPKRRCRRFQFRLRTLMMVVTLFCVFGGYVGHQVQLVHERKLVLDWITAHNGEVAITRKNPGAPDYRPSIPWLRRILGDSAVARVNFGSSLNTEDEGRIREAFPEIEDIRIGGKIIAAHTILGRYLIALHTTRDHYRGR